MSCLGGADDDSIHDGASNSRVPDAVHEANAQKLHTYNIYRALKLGHMPSTDQILVYLKDIERSEALSDEEGLSQDGRVLLRLFRRWIAESSELLENKNGQDQLQSFLWYARKADFKGGRSAVASVAGAKNKADARAAVESGRTVLSMVLGNSDFRELIADLAAFAREVVGDTKKAVKQETHEAHEELLDLDNGRLNIVDDGGRSRTTGNGDADRNFNEENQQPSMDPEHSQVHFDGRTKDQSPSRSQHQHQNSQAISSATNFSGDDEREAYLADELNKHPDCPGCQEEFQLAKARGKAPVTEKHQYTSQSSPTPSSGSSDSSASVPTIEVTGPSGQGADPGNGKIDSKSQRKKEKKARMIAAKAQAQNQEIPPHVQQQIEKSDGERPTDAEIVKGLPDPSTEQPPGSGSEGQSGEHRQISPDQAAAAKDSAHPVALSPPSPPPAKNNSQDNYWDVAEQQQQQKQDGQPVQAVKDKIKSTSAGVKSQSFAQSAKSKINSAANTARQNAANLASNAGVGNGSGAKDPTAAADIATTHAARAAITAKNAALRRAHGKTGKALRMRIQHLIGSLSQQNTYASSAGTISHLLRQYLQAYARAADEAADAVGRHIEPNDASGQAFKSFWKFLTGLGDGDQWRRTEASFHEVLHLGRDEASLELMAVQISDLVEDMLTKPEFFDNPEARLKDFKNETVNVAPGFGDALLDLLASLGDALASVGDDADLLALGDTTGQIVDVLFPDGKGYNTALLSDVTNSAIPLLLSTIQYIPIPRVEISTPQIDLLLENLVLEPGKSIGGSSFFPHDISIDNMLSLSMSKRRRRAYTDTKGQITITTRGVCMKADNVGYWMHVHKSLARFRDSGLASFAVDGRGMDIEMELDLRNSNTNMLVLRRVKVTVHQLAYKLRASKFSCIASLCKPLIKPILKAAMERQIEKLVRDNMADLNTELVFARERVRAARTAHPRSPGTFVRAVCARRHRDRYDIDVRVGVTQPGKGVFRGRYAPGSLVREWNAERVRERTNDHRYKADGWRSDIFSKGETGRVHM
ncbi:hypothetical protein BROUX41_004221 [Berkeleyomyces rouxiae]|uniref:uncharacterized protein n=1 Tax=Berkeleyomyces rouxiae TaxID=2035830 RepID=UPI003B820785